MKYTVTWTPAAERQLTDIWLRTDRREVISAAANKMDSMLREDPHNAGESRPFDLRILFELPLAALYRIEPEDNAVQVTVVWEVKSHKNE